MDPTDPPQPPSGEASAATESTSAAPEATTDDGWRKEYPDLIPKNKRTLKFMFDNNAIFSTTPCIDKFSVSIRCLNISLLNPFIQQSICCAAHKSFCIMCFKGNLT